MDKPAQPFKQFHLTLVTPDPHFQLGSAIIIAVSTDGRNYAISGPLDDLELSMRLMRELQNHVQGLLLKTMEAARRESEHKLIIPPSGLLVPN